MIGLEEFGYRIPRPGWPGRRRAIARILLGVTVRAVVVLLLITAVTSCTIALGASMNALPR